MKSDFKKELMVGLGIIVTSLVGFFVIFGQLDERLATLSASVSAAQSNINHKAQLLSDLAELKRNSGSANEYKRKMEALLPERDQLYSYQRYLENLAVPRKLNFNFIFQGEPVVSTPTAPGSAAFNLDVSGSIDGILMFMRDAEIGTTRNIMSIENFDLTRDSGEIYRLQLSGKTYFR